MENNNLEDIVKIIVNFLVAEKVILGDDSRYVREIYAAWSDSPVTAGVFVAVTDCE